MTLRGELSRSSIGLGTAGFAFKDIADADATDTIVDAVARGVRLIDTARAYTRPGEESTAEVIVARALRRLGETNVLIASKGGHWREGVHFPVDGRAATLRSHCEASLRIMGIDCIDLYFLHHVDPAVPLEESVMALDELRCAGAIRHIGLSNVTLAQLDRATEVAPISAVQNRLSLAHPEDADLAKACSRREIAFLAYSPLGGSGSTIPAAASRIAQLHGASPAQVQLAWLMAVAPGTIPIVGSTRTSTVRDSLGAKELKLSDQELAELTDAPRLKTAQ